MPLRQIFSPMSIALLRRAAEAVGENDAPAVRRAIAAGVDLGPALAGGQTLLMLAAEGGCRSALRALLPHSDARLADRKGLTALMMAASHGCPNCVSQLMAASDAQARNAEGKDALFFAAWAWSVGRPEGKLECLRLLAEKIDASRPQGSGLGSRSVLRMAVRGHDATPEMFELLGPRHPMSEEAAEALANWGAQALPLTHAARERALLLAAAGAGATSREGGAARNGAKTEDQPSERARRL
jgi:hypothetical protein